jgi:fumarate hydratase class II
MVMPSLYRLALGEPPSVPVSIRKGYDQADAAAIAKKTGIPFITAENKFETRRYTIVEVSGMLNGACSLNKIANDVRLLGSGPDVDSILLPTTGAASCSKVNPTR